MDSKFSHLPDISTIQPDRLIKYRISEDRFSAEVLLPGLSYTDFDQKIGGKVSLWSLGKVFEAARWQGMIHGLIYYPELRKQHAMFVASQSMHLSKEINDIRYRNHFGLKRPLKASLYVSNVGKTSFTIVTELFDYNSGLQLSTNVFVVVIVDKTLRKPAKLPEQFLAGIDKHFNEADSLTIERAVLPTIPNDAFQYQVKGLHSDTDMYAHVTQMTYTRWCSDATSKAALKGHLTKFKRHIELYPLKFTECHFIGEVLANGIVTVNVWEGQGSDRTLLVAIAKGTRIIFTMKMEFYDGEPAEVSPHLRSKL